MRDVQLAIVGGGPAGIAAAVEARRAGAEVVLIDEYLTLGGQYYKQVPEAFSIDSGRREARQYAEGTERLQELTGSGVELLLDTLVWGIFDQRTLAVLRNDRAQQIRGQQLILAPGAQEVPVAFPGWTLPGVMMGGAAQALMVSQRLRPGQKVVLAGVGPLQLKVASQFLDAGGEVLAILEASNKPPTSMEYGLRSLGHWSKMREGLEYFLKIMKASTPYLHSHVPVRAIGTEELEAVVIAEVDEHWRVRPGAERTIEADTLCLSYGFLPSTQLTRLAGCRLVFPEEAGGWVTYCDGDQRTSVPGVYAAGEVGGIGGADVAEAEGRLAALAAVRALGIGTPERLQDRMAQVRKELGQARKFADLTRAMMAVKPGLFDLMTDDTIVCRCEASTAGEIRAAVHEGDPTLRGIKIRTRAGMGRCQGRQCGPLVARLIAKELGWGLEAIELDTPRPPVKPVPLRALARGEL